MKGDLYIDFLSAMHNRNLWMDKFVDENFCKLEFMDILLGFLGIIIVAVNLYGI